MKTLYEQELQNLKPWDEVQTTEEIEKNGVKYDFIVTAGHGYLVVNRTSKHFRLAKSIAEFGFIGDYAVYLEEDSEASKFLKSIE